MAVARWEAQPADPAELTLRGRASDGVLLAALQQTSAEQRDRLAAASVLSTAVCNALSFCVDAAAVAAPAAGGVSQRQAHLPVARLAAAAALDLPCPPGGAGAAHAERMRFAVPPVAARPADGAAFEFRDRDRELGLLLLDNPTGLPAPSSAALEPIRCGVVRSWWASPVGALNRRGEPAWRVDLRPDALGEVAEAQVDRVLERGNDVRALRVRARGLPGGGACCLPPPPGRGRRTSRRRARRGCWARCWL